MSTDLRFVSLGFDTVLQANMVCAVMRVRSQQSKRILTEAKNEKRWMDFTANRSTKSIILLTNNVVITSPFSVATILGRLKAVTENSVSIDSKSERIIEMASKGKRHIYADRNVDGYEELDEIPEEDDDVDMEDNFTDEDNEGEFDDEDEV